jgi:hypothetical protein
MITGFVSVGTVAAKLYRDLGINKEINFSDIVEWSNEILLKIGAYSQFVEIPDKLELIEGKVCLPNGFYKLVDISFEGKPLHWATNTLAHNYGCEGCQIPKCCTPNNFYINDSYIITDIDSSTCSNKPEICIVYLGMPVDCDGYPMIPDDIYFAEACAKYCTYMLDYQDWRKGQLPDKVLNKSETDYLWYCNSARGAANQPSLAQLENLKNIMTRLIPKVNDYNSFFRNTGSQERRHRY